MLSQGSSRSHSLIRTRAFIVTHCFHKSVHSFFHHQATIFRLLVHCRIYIFLKVEGIAGSISVQRSAYFSISAADLLSALSSTFALLANAADFTNFATAAGATALVVIAQNARQGEHDCCKHLLSAGTRLSCIRIRRCNCQVFEIVVWHHIFLVKWFACFTRPLHCFLKLDFVKLANIYFCFYTVKPSVRLPFLPHVFFFNFLILHILTLERQTCRQYIFRCRITAVTFQCSSV